MPTPPRSPAPLVVARVLAVVQLVAAVLVAVGGGVVTTASSAANGGWEGLVVAVGVGVLVLGLGAGILLGVPLLVMAGATPTRRVTGRGLLVMAELVVLAPPLVVSWGRWGTPVPLGVDPADLVVDLLLVLPVVVVGCLLAPSVGRWAEPAPTTVGVPVD